MRRRINTCDRYHHTHVPLQAIMGALGVSFVASGVLYVGINRGRE